MHRLHFDHWWISKSEVLALDCLQQALHERGVQLTADEATADASAHLMSAQNVWDGVCGRGPRPIDLARWLSPFDLETRLFAPFRAVCSPSHLSLYGIPIGASRTNSLWVNRQIADVVGGPPEDVCGLHAWLDRASAIVQYPLGLSRENWQVSLLLEAVVLSMHGPDFLRRAFGLRCPSAIASSRMHESLEFVSQLRRFVAPSHAGTPWHVTAADCQARRCAAIVMGDWVHNEFCRSPGGISGDYQSVYKWVVPSTGGSFLYTVDYIVPVERASGPSNPEVLAILAQALLAPQVQGKFGLIKGALPAVRDAYGSNIDPSLWKMFHLATLCPDVLIPSMSLLQGSPRYLRDAVAYVVRELLYGNNSSAAAHSTLIALANGTDGASPLNAVNARAARPDLIEEHHGFSTDAPNAASASKCMGFDADQEPKLSCPRSGDAGHARPDATRDPARQHESRHL